MEKGKIVNEKKMEGSESYYSKNGMNAPGWCQSDKPAELHWDDAPAGDATWWSAMEDRFRAFLE